MNDIRIEFRGTLGRFSLDAAFTVPAIGVTTLFGPSGCGKTTVLRCIAGLQRLDGVCIVADEIWQNDKTFRPAHQRDIGYVFQEASLFAHLSVRRNLLYGAIRTGAIRFEEVVDLLGLAKLLDRAPQNLSGGERQRVAIGRALLSQPRLLLMDEPLSALDRITKEEILPFLERLQETLALPIIHVSHDMTEVERLADHLVLMQAGRVVASGPLTTLQSDPSLSLVQSREAAVSLHAIVESFDVVDGLASLVVNGGRFLAPSAPVAQGTRRRLRILAGDVSLARTPQHSTIVNTLPARILKTTPTGTHGITAVLGLGPEGAGDRILARVTQRSWKLLELSQGMDVHAQIKGVALISGSPP